jgi:hypothetical protein
VSPGIAGPPVLPRALEHLMGLARALASPTGAQDGLRTWVTVPTSRLAIGASILGALSATTRCDGCFHADLHAGDRVAVYVDSKFQDTELSEITREGQFRYAGVRIPCQRASVYRLPVEFPADRHAGLLSAEDKLLLADAYQCVPDLAGHRHLHASGHPVLVVGHPERTRDDLRAWTPLAAQRSQVRRAAATDIDDWYRSAVLTTGTSPTLTRRPWLTQVRPRLVITTTTSAALAPTPWPDVPVLALLSRRSPSSVHAADLAHQMRTTPVTVDGRLGLALRPGHGLEIFAAYVPCDLPMPVDDDDLEEQW